MTLQFFARKGDGLYDAYAATEEEVGGASVADEGERLTGDGQHADSDGHVDDCLEEDERAETSGTEAAERSAAGGGDAYATEVEPGIEREDNESREGTSFFNDDGVDKVIVGLGHEPAVDGGAYAAAKEAAARHGHACHVFLSELVGVGIKP